MAGVEWSYDYSLYIFGHVCAVCEVEVFLSLNLFCLVTLRSVGTLWLPFGVPQKIEYVPGNVVL